MGSSLQAQQQAAGAVIADHGSSRPLSFGNDAIAREAAQTGVALVDRSHWGRLRVANEDRLRFLHNQTTQNLQSLAPGQGRDTVFVNSTGRTLDLVTAYVTDDAVLLMTSPGQAEPLMAWMDRYIFFADKVTLANETAATAALTLIGPDSPDLLARLGLTDLADQPVGCHRLVTLGDMPVRVAVGSGLSLPGYTLIAAAEVAGDLWQQLQGAGAVPLGDRVWEQLRVVQGRPMPGAELTEEHNPLEAGLWHTVSFDKGCYIGQETIARLNTYQGVKQQLWGLQLNAPVPAGTPLILEEQKVGQVTSVVETADGVRGLGYVRTKVGGQGLILQAEDARAEVVDIPFASRGYLAP